jgi:hypothetical protein
MNVQSKAVLPAFGIGAVAALLIGASLWAERNVAPGLMPHGVCFTWMPALLWLHVLSDALIGLAYLTIPITLVYFVRRRRDLPTKPPADHGLLSKPLRSFRLSLPWKPPLAIDHKF